jgi:hypothetical protein
VGDKAKGISKKRSTLVTEGRNRNSSVTPGGIRLVAAGGAGRLQHQVCMQFCGQRRRLQERGLIHESGRGKWRGVPGPA